MAERTHSARDRLLVAAAELFYDGGIAATGIDAVIKAAGVAKMSLYNNFQSKDELVRAYIDARHAEWLGLYAERLARAETPLARVLAVFEAYEDHAACAYAHGFRGCGILNAAAELPADSPGRAAVREHKEEVERLLLGHVREYLPPGDGRAREKAEHLAFLLEGAMARAGLEGNGGRLAQAKRMAAAVLEQP